MMILDSTNAELDVGASSAAFTTAIRNVSSGKATLARGGQV